MVSTFYANIVHNVFITHESASTRCLMKLFPRFAALVLALFAVAGVACTDSEAMEDSVGAPAAGSGAVRVVHLSPDAPPVDILVNGQPAIQGLAFPTASGYA